ncbi:hypothetical protein CFP56_031220, partial [Quercus suber]
MGARNGGFFLESWVESEAVGPDKERDGLNLKPLKRHIFLIPIMMMMIRSLSPLEDSPSFIMAWVTCSMISLLPILDFLQVMRSGQIADGFTTIFAGEL